MDTTHEYVMHSLLPHFYLMPGKNKHEENELEIATTWLQVLTEIRILNFGLAGTGTANTTRNSYTQGS